jgi:hypothetical protein
MEPAADTTQALQAALDAARQARAAAGEAYDAAVATGTGEDVDAAFKHIDDTQRDLGEVDAAHTAAQRAFTDADNRCLTDVDAVRRASTSREVDRG